MFALIAVSPRQTLRKRVAMGAAVLAIAIFAVGFSYALNFSEKRVFNDSVRFGLSPPSATNWTTENAYPGLRFFEPTCVAYPNDGSQRVFVLERRGTIVSFKDDPQVTAKHQILDLRSQVWRTEYEDDGAVAIALHPEFGNPDSSNGKFFYLLYTAKVDGKRFNRLSRFTLDGQVAGQQLVLMDQQDENIWHNGGGLTFGPDGFLYVGVGDEGTNGDGLENGQRIDRDLYCGILRIDVDCRGGDVSHPPPRQPDTGKTAGYFIPNDNPFVGVAGVLEEFWAHGLRNPYRAAFDRETGELWVSDVGHLRREEVNLIEKGGNYGWSYREGSLEFSESYLNGDPPEIFYGIEKKPIWEYPHLNGDNCVIGGFVYRGANHPELRGKYLVADNGSGRVWALSRVSENAVTNEEILSLAVSAKTGIASLQPDANGEPLVIILGRQGKADGMIHRILEAPAGSTETIPSKLSRTGLFSDMASLTPNPGVIPYEVNISQAMGDARIQRWLVLPGDGTDPDPGNDRIGTTANAAWEFPTGTVFVQHFDLPIDHHAWRPIETRILVRHQQGGVYGVTYRWNEAGTDATLVENTGTTASIIDSKSNLGHSSSWHFLDRQSCMACHNQNAGFVLGVNPRQLNRQIKGRSLLGYSQQLIAWNKAGMFRDPSALKAMLTGPTLVSLDDSNAPIEAKARSYLDVNCAACHRVGGARASFMAGFNHTKSPAALQIKPKQGDFGIADARVVAAGDPFRSVLYYRMAKLGQGRMPFVGAHQLDADGLSLLRTWIERMEPHSAEIVDREILKKRENQLQIVDQLISSDPQDNSFALLPGLLEDTSGAFSLWQQLHDGRVSMRLRESVISLATESPHAPTRDLFEWYLPAESRSQRLGTHFDLSDVLRLKGDAERGRQMYVESDSLLCRNCHSIRSNDRSLGPRLDQVAQKLNRSELLYHIVHPSERIDPAFATWKALTDDGQILSGLLVQQTDQSVLLRDANGKDHRIEVSSLEQFEQASQSMMPTHLLQSLTAAEAADLLEYLKSVSVPGEQI